MKKKSIFEANTEKEQIVHCPLCNGIMKKRTGKWGDFYACSMYFKTGCQGKRKVQEVEIMGLGVEIVKEKYIPTTEEDKPTDDKDVKLVETKKYPHLKFKFKNFNPVQSRVFEVYNRDANFVIAAATSAGKTAMAEMIMAESISKGKKAAFLSPLKAVSEQKYGEWTDSSHGFSKKKISIVTGDYQLTDKRVKELNEADIVIMTCEMLDTRTRRINTEKNDWLLDIDTLVEDEFHIIMTNRGDKVESAFMRFTKQNPACKLVALSATMPNVSQIAKWFTFLNRKETILINSSYRPIQLDVHYETYQDKRKYSVVEDNKINKAYELTLKKIKIDEQVLLFVHSKNTGHKLLDYFKNKGIEAKFHYADLTLDERKKIEQDTKNKKLKVLIATSTLAWGVNI
jgi:replicative superfamily II helicase